VAFYADKDYTEDQAVLDAMSAVMQGNLTLHWFEPETERVKCRPADSRRGLTYEDVNAGSYGYSAIPEFVRDEQSMAARGSAKPGNYPDMGYAVNRKSEVWSDNVTALYEESKARRWAPAIDVPWSALDTNPLPHAVESACAQLYTFLQECALAALDFPSRWVALINQEFIEQKSFMCAQMLDGARLLEAFRKRALYGGAGMGRASAAAEQGLKELLWAPSYPSGSLSINIGLQGFLLAIYRQIAAFPPSRVDRVIMAHAMQDAARHASYGLSALRYYLARQPEERPGLARYLDDSEHALAAVMGAPELLEPLIIISGGGLGNSEIDSGRDAVRKFIRLAYREYAERLNAAGLDRCASRLAAIVAQVSA
jgi:hypothetical protein